MPEDSPIEGDLTLESVVEGIYVHGSVDGRFAMRCARCLKEFERDFDVAMSEMYVARAGSRGRLRRSTPDLTLDPEPMVRDAVVLEMPFSPLCRTDCLGLCAVCGGDRNLGECPGHEVPDPRWAALEAFLDLAGDPSDRTTTRKDETMPVPKRRQITHARRQAQGELEGAASHLLRVPAVSPAQAPASGVRELRVLRRSPGHRGRVSGVSPERASEGPRALDRVLGVRFKDAALRETALTHRSYAFENELPVNNERLEFLGDAVLGIVVTDMAFRRVPRDARG